MSEGVTPERTLAVLGGTPLFDDVLHVGRPNIGDRARFLGRVEEMLDRRWFSNDGPLVREFERKVAEYVGVRHCVAMCNATVALEIATRALGVRGEVILPAYTFVATAHAMQWQGITPVFADMDPATHNIDPASIARLITPRTGAIVGVHVWGRGCDTEAIEAIGRSHGIPVMYDAAHAFGCSKAGRMIGGFGACEVFSFHATKFLNSFEGGAVVTDDDTLAERMRMMRNFGFAGLDRVVALGVNGKMTEVCAAMGLTSLEAIDALIARNEENFHSYRRALADLPGLRLIQYDQRERNNYQYVVVEVDPGVAPLDRDEIVAVLHADRVLARKYFWPGVHRGEPYRTMLAGAEPSLPATTQVAASILILPTGQTIDAVIIERIVQLIRTAFAHASEVRERLRANA
jgi:dTDP-4-amino-4,6-dideoxygalactose transaminase